METTPHLPGDGIPPRGPKALPKGVIGSLLAYVEARGVLLSIEAQEALQQVVKILAFAVVGIIAAFTGWLSLNGVAIGLLIHFFHFGWIAATAILMGANLLTAALSLLLAKKSISSTRWFSDTLNELTKDRAWLAKQTESN